jgi:hypothetical protein
MSNATKIDKKVVNVNISMGMGALNSAIMGAIIANIRPTRLQMPKAVALIDVGKSQGVAI